MILNLSKLDIDDQDFILLYLGMSEKGKGVLQSILSKAIIQVQNRAEINDDGTLKKHNLSLIK